MLVSVRDMFDSLFRQMLFLSGRKIIIEAARVRRPPRLARDGQSLPATDDSRESLSIAVGPGVGVASPTRSGAAAADSAKLLAAAAANLNS